MFQHRQNDVRISRREWLQVAGLGAINVAWPKTLWADRKLAALQQPQIHGFGTAKSCVVVFLFGGPGQQDLWDLKPNAPAEVRGEFRPIASKVSGMLLSDQLPKLSKQTDKITIVRSVSHTDFEHGSASYTALTGHPHPKPGTNTPASPDDFPTYGAVVSLLRPAGKTVPDAAVLGPVMHQGNRPPMAGQNAGFLGDAYEPFRIADDPNRPEFRVSGLNLPEDLDPQRIDQRFRMLESLDLLWQSSSQRVEGMSQLKRRAVGLLRSTHAQRAFDLTKEVSTTRDTYGRHKFGQTMLLARRLVEAEVPLITINWSKLNADQWDTHAKNYPTLREKLLPPFDQGFAAFLHDLDQRNLLETTLVICLGEFGRTPKINKDAGRDHWPDCYSVVMAGGGVRKGFIHGASDRIAAYPETDPVAPWDLAATMYHLLGIEPQAEIKDRLNRPFTLSSGRVVRELLL